MARFQVDFLAQWVNPEIRNKRVKVDNKAHLSLYRRCMWLQRVFFADPQNFLRVDGVFTGPAASVGSIARGLSLHSSA